ncbi:nucleoside triphosphate pyrophosphohydrolase [Phosphitispora fastidiosa]|uniref:nucleoside triphosphate pyrophosphohydrolase n=1 Tax=Phosphitispora fastidiosa TaxID=2837202 RepID=UPI001E4F07F1|nr:tetrapyrrole methylase family protein/MazG family protein [Phosphitispora fastidiosa]
MAVIAKELLIVGLGPGDVDLISIGTFEKIKNARKLLLRTGKHPAAEELRSMGLEFETFDHLYERYGDFAEIYSEIAVEVVRLAGEGPVVFAVPGNPLVGEEAVLRIIQLALEANLSYEIVPAMSFLDPVLTGLGLDLSGGLKLVDGLQLAGEERNPAANPDPLVSNIIMQVYNSRVASEVKLSLMEFYPDEHPVTVISAAGAADQVRIEEIPLFELDRLPWVDHLTCVHVPPYLESKSMVSRYPADRLVGLLEILRSEAGCPWDKDQTHTSLKKYLVEETYEVIDAIEEGNMYKVCEELGDLLLQIAFHAQIAAEQGFFDMNDVIGVIADKLIRRHPHVFGDTYVRNSEEVSIKWEEIKKNELKEKGETRNSLLDGIPNHMPALMKADKIQRRAAKVGFDWSDYRGALDKVSEELMEVCEAIDSGNSDKVREEIGDILFAVVNLARFKKIDPEEALALTNRKFKNRFVFMEESASNSGKDLSKMSLDELDRLWNNAKLMLQSKK